jgi:DNA repair protein SbcC/Rad50
MRPVRLTMQAFGPYPTRETLDFREAVEAGLFGIYGQTGSGKSTIFSAMTFALFGEPAKSEQDAPSLRSDHADTGVQTEVEFVFDIGERRFVVLRQPEQMRPSKRGEGDTRSPHAAFLFDATGLALDDITEGQRGKIIAEKKVRDVDAAVLEILGYGPEQFRQIVLLPQGKFETFLAAKTPDRLKILRELFDVSLYRDLAARLKADAEAVEQQVSQERELCARRVAAENFESTEALAIGITEAEGHLRELLARENASRMAFAAAQTAMEEARTTEAHFSVSEETQKTHALLQDGKSTMDALFERVVRAERARSLLDPETSVTTAAGEVRAAEAKLGNAQKAATGADTHANLATQTLKAETDRAGEIEVLRRQVEEFERNQQTLEKAASITKGVETAEKAERESREAVRAAEEKVGELQDENRKQADALRLARLAREHRHSLAARLATLKSSLLAAETFEEAQADVEAAGEAVGKAAAENENALRLAEGARGSFEEAECSLSEAQAMHLAAKLTPGEPCPVCGASEHPAPANGSVEHYGLDQAFRDASARLKSADATFRLAENALTSDRSVLLERQLRFASLETPARSAGAIRTDIAASNESLVGLGPPVDIAKAEAGIEHLKGAIEAGGKVRDALRDAFVEKQKEAASEKSRLDEMLSSIPVPLRDHATLTASREKTQQALTARCAAKAQAETAATATREAALAAAKDRQATEAALETCRNRYRKALESFRSRLEQVGLSGEDFRMLKPAIATINKDRARVEEHRRRLEIAEEAAKRAADIIRDQVRPNLPGIEAKRIEAEGTLTEATNQRAGADHRLDHLTKLRDDLAETRRKLDEAEAASGPLRKLAALANGVNPQSLDLETFAIGAMFDQVLDAANLRLGPMTSNRYRLERDLEGGGRGRRGLGIQAFDVHTGKARSMATLSGGESFIAALALALGLASVVENASGKVRLDTIFIDEGFGSLDTENGAGTLDQVLQVLGTLVSQSRAVGIISHVPLVQVAIPNGFYVRKNWSGSIVEARGAFE